MSHAAASPHRSTRPDGAIWAALPRARVAVANVIGAVVVYIFLALVVQPNGTIADSFAIEFGSVLLYWVIAVAVGLRIGNRGIEPIARWLRDERDPSPDEVTITLLQPLRQARVVFALWLGAAALFAGLHMTPTNPIHHDPGYGGMVGAVIVLGGLAAGMLTYLLVEQSMRPIFALALERTGPPGLRTLGVKRRIMVAWALGSGIVLVALGLAPLGSGRLDLAIAFLAPVGLIVGATIIGSAANSIAHPITAMRTAVGRVEHGDFSARVAVDDASEVGLLQAGFNQMVEGLADRERIRRMFGTYVDPEIAAHVLQEGVSMEGEDVEATMMFIDIRGFTSFSAKAAAREVVATVNRLFALIVPLVHMHGGHVNKFVGDGLLAVFGAPRRYTDHADRGLEAAIEIASAVRAEFGKTLEIGIGLNSGEIVAGNVGGAGRFEFSVIGDAVNVAAHVEAATRSTGDPILLSEDTKRFFVRSGAGLEMRPDVPLKGKQHPVQLFAPTRDERRSGERP